MKGKVIIIFSTVALSLFLLKCTSRKQDIVYPQPDICDTVNVTYSKTIFPIIQTYCFECHSGPSPVSGISYDNYAGLKKKVDDGLVLGNVEHAPGFDPMPKNRPKLSDCNIAKIRIWIQDGAPNN